MFIVNVRIYQCGSNLQSQDYNGRIKL